MLNKRQGKKLVSFLYHDHEKWSELEYAKVIDAFKQRWCPPSAIFAAEVEFRVLQQTGSLDDYITEFHESIAVLDPAAYTDEYLQLQFLAGLHPGITSRLPQQTLTLSETIAKAVKIDNEWKMKKQEQQEKRKFTGNRGLNTGKEFHPKSNRVSYNNTDEKNHRHTSHKGQYQKHQHREYDSDIDKKASAKQIQATLLEDLHIDQY